MMYLLQEVNVHSNDEPSRDKGIVEFPIGIGYVQDTSGHLISPVM